MWRKLWVGLANRSVAGWIFLVIGTGVLGGGVWWNVREAILTWSFVDAVLVTATPGGMEIVTCDAGTESKGNWTCHGPFISDDGTVRIDSISLRVPLEAGPGAIMAAAVTDSGAVQGWVPHWGMAFGRLGVHFIVGWAGYGAWWVFRESWTSGRKSPPAVVPPRAGRRPGRPLILLPDGRAARLPRLPRNAHRDRRRKKK
jgi:hypothetical protein